MNFPLKSKKEEAMLIDTSIHSSCSQNSLTEILYRGRRGIINLDEDEIDGHLTIIGEMRELVIKKRVYAISEVKEELTEFLNLLNRQKRFISVTEKKINPRAYNEKFKKEEDIGESLEKLGLYSDILYETIRLLDNKDPRQSFNNWQMEIYDRALFFTQNMSKDLIAESYEQKLRMNKHPNFLGNKLKTDCKLVSCAFALSYQEPVTIVSRDHGIEKVVGRAAFKFPKFQRNGIEVYNPDYDGPLTKLMEN